MNTSSTAYKASAGSGKTFTLSSEYIKLLIENPDSFKNILAVTFTNKATEEMKLRILSQLYGISKQLPDSKSYFDRLKAETKLPDNIIQQNANLALTKILHNYNYFQIQTIDTFFQSILRNLARELELTANLRVSLNNDTVVSIAVDQLVEELQENSKEIEMVMSYINSKIEDAKKWNIINELKEFGKNIFNDLYRNNEHEISNLLNDKKKFDSYKKKLKEIRKNALDTLNKYATDFQELLQQHHVDASSFSRGKTGVLGYFTKLNPQEYTSSKILNATAQEGLENSKKWLRSENQDASDPLFQLVETTLRPLMNKIEKQRKELFKAYNSASVILNNLHQLSLLSNIASKVNDINNENNQFLLNNTQAILNAMIKDQDAPFIFEKVGTRINHIMIDEFQDTSTSQWKSFQSLLKELTSDAEKTSLIVGDVKQSIYRWRNGDWRLLNNIEQIFQSMGASIQVKNLTTNYRSCRNIIEFNNVFFTNACHKEIENLNNISPFWKQQLQHAYADVVQQVPKNKPQEGFVQVQIHSENTDKEVIYEQTLNIIQKLLAQNVHPKDIAILLRNTKEMDPLVEYLSDKMPKLSFLSAEAFKLSASTSVSMIINALRFLKDDTNQLALITLAKEYQTHVLNNKDIDFLFCNHKEQWHLLLPSDFYAQLAELKELPLIDLVERISKMFHLEKISNQSAYLCGFSDLITNFIETYGSDMLLFLEEWDNNLNTTSIDTSGSNGISIMTIHKSKGLEFEHLIIPFCDWELEKSTANIWVENTDSKFNDLPIIPVRNSKQYKEDSVFDEQLAEEHVQMVVDNLNLLYVAFTRACRNLFIFATSKSKGSYRDKLLKEVISDLNLNNELTTFEEIKLEKGSIITFTYGEWTAPNIEKSKKTTQNVFLTSAKEQEVHIQSFDYSPSFMQSNNSKEFIEDNENELQRLQYIKEGNIYHSVLSYMQTLNDLDKAIEKLEISGVLTTPEWSKENVKHTLQEKFKNPKVASWFNEKYNIFNECTILYLDENTGKVINKRPDRVIYDGNEMIVIDFKTGNPYPAHHKQVKQYITLLKEMGYNKVSGYLWYLDNNNIEDVR